MNEWTDLKPDIVGAYYAMRRLVGSEWTFPSLVMCAKPGTIVRPLPVVAPGEFGGAMTILSLDPCSIHCSQKVEYCGPLNIQSR